MPNSQLDYDKHGRIARVKPRTKEQDARSVASSSGSSRRHRDSSTSSSRTALPSEHPSQQPESASSSLILEQLPSLPESGPGSPLSMTSPMSRTISNVSAPTSMTSPSLHRVPASLQPYLEPEDEYFRDNEESQATPKAEKSREQSEVKLEPPKSEVSRELPPASDTDQHLVSHKKSSASESTKAVRTRSSPRAAPAPALDYEIHREVQQPAPKRPPSSNSSIGFGPATPAPPYSYVNAAPVQPSFAGQQAFPSPQMTYLPLPQITDPSVNHQALVPHGMLYYPDYGPQPSAPTLQQQQQLQYGPIRDSDRENEDPTSLLQRVHSTLPDLHALISSYQDLYGRLESREEQVRIMEIHRATQMQQQANRIAKLERELESVVNKHAADSGQLKLHISEMDKRCNYLQERWKSESKARESLQTANDALRSEQRRMEKKYEEGKAALTRKLSHEKDSMAAEHRARQKTMHDQLQAQLQGQSQKAEAHLSLRIAEINGVNEREKQELENAWTKRRRELEDKHENAICSLEDALEAKQKVVDEERRTYLQAREGWDREREIMLRRWDEERGMLRKASEEQHRTMTTKHERETNEIMKQVSQMQNRTDKDDLILKLQKENEALRGGWEADRFKYQQKASDFKTTARTLNEQNSKLQRLMEGFGDAVDAKGK